MHFTLAPYRTQLIHDLSTIGEAQWSQLLAQQAHANPFLSYAFLHAMHASHSASTASGWKVCFLSLWENELLVAVMPLYEKSHSYGEYVFDWAWANAYQEHGLSYYPKLLSAIPFTPVCGQRLIAKDGASKNALLNALTQLLASTNYSSAHVLFPPEEEIALFEQAGFLIRTGVQFHWKNQGFGHFDDFLATLSLKKRKNIRAERKKVQEAGVTFEQLTGNDISKAHWDFFKSCYDQTYYEHRSTPYLNADFFARVANTMPNNVTLIIANKADKAIASSLLIHDENTLYGRYWGCLESVSCLHFETAYYQAIEFCIQHKIATFEGGAQGEHKLARGFLPVKTFSAHLLAEPAFADAVSRFLEREQHGIDNYIDELNEHSPYKHGSSSVSI